MVDYWCVRAWRCVCVVRMRLSECICAANALIQPHTLACLGRPRPKDQPHRAHVYNVYSHIHRYLVRRTVFAANEAAAIVF